MTFYLIIDKPLSHPLKRIPRVFWRPSRPCFSWVTGHFKGRRMLRFNLLDSPTWWQRNSFRIAVRIYYTEDFIVLLLTSFSPRHPTSVVDQPLVQKRNRFKDVLGELSRHSSSTLWTRTWVKLVWNTIPSSLVYGRREGTVSNSYPTYQHRLYIDTYFVPTTRDRHLLVEKVDGRKTNKSPDGESSVMVLVTDRDLVVRRP